MFVRTIPPSEFYAVFIFFPFMPLFSDVRAFGLGFGLVRVNVAVGVIASWEGGEGKRREGRRRG